MELLIVLKNDPEEQKNLEQLLAQIGTISVNADGRLVLRVARFGPDAVHANDLEVSLTVTSVIGNVIRAVNGALELVPGPVRRVDVAEFWYVDASGTEKRFPPAAPTNFRYALVGKRFSPLLLSYVKAAAHDLAARRVLGYLEKYGDWFSLYKAYEILRDEMGGEESIGEWASPTEQSTFRRTANSYDILGDAARHGVQYQPPPEKPMSYDQAHKMVQKIVKRWLSEIVVKRVDAE